MPTSFGGSIGNFLLHIDPLMIFMFALTFAILGLVLSVVYKSKLNADRQSKNWPSVSGKITTSRVEKRAGYKRSGSANRSAVYVPLIKYSYTVTGTLYHGDSIGNGIYQAFTRLGPNGWVKRYPTQTEVIVYYNPANPAEALLEPTSNSNIVGFIVAMGLDLLGIVLIIIWIYRLIKG